MIASKITAVHLLILFSLLITMAKCKSGSHSRGGGERQYGGGGRQHHRGIDWDTTKTCADELANGNCDSFRKCCEHICEPAGGGFQSECIMTNGVEAQLRCHCIGGGAGGSGGRGHGGGGGEGGDQSNTTPVFHQWRPSRTQRPSNSATQAVTVAPARPARPAGGNKGCGVPTVQPTARIVGGQEAKPHSWPWQISLQLRGRHLCGGSLISQNHILTAAHCFSLSSRTSNYRVAVGMHDRSKGDGTTVGISKIYIHPKYDEEENSNDAAIAVLSQPVSFSDNITPICLPQRDVPEGTSCEATGWGHTEGTGNNRYLLQVRVPIISRSVCNDRSHYRGRIDDTMICAGAAGKDSCQGDSGGPLVCQRSDGVWEQQGITSWGSDCGQQNRPGVYTRVVSVKDWVNQMMKSK